MTYAIPAGAKWAFETRPLNAAERMEQMEQCWRAERFKARSISAVGPQWHRDKSGWPVNHLRAS